MTSDWQLRREWQWDGRTLRIYLQTRTPVTSTGKVDKRAEPYRSYCVTIDSTEPENSNSFSPSLVEAAGSALLDISGYYDLPGVES